MAFAAQGKLQPKAEMVQPRSPADILRADETLSLTLNHFRRHLTEAKFGRPRNCSLASGG